MLRPAPHRPRGGRLALQPGQSLLLQAAVGPSASAWEAYVRWSRGVVLDRLDVASQRALPAMYQTLSAADPERMAASTDEASSSFDPLIAQCRKVARFTLLRSRMILDSAGVALGALSAKGLPVMVLKGTAVLHHVPGVLAARPMDDADLAVPTGEAADAIEALLAAGFEVIDGPAPAGVDLEWWTERHHALELRAPGGAEIDLHWHVLVGAKSEAADALFWDTAVKAALDGRPCLATGREATMLQAVGHAFAADWAHGLRWATDLVMLERAVATGASTSSDRVDWVRLAELARGLRLTLPLADTLTVLADLGLSEPPGDLVASLRRAPLTLRLEARPRRDWQGRSRLPRSVETSAYAYAEHLRSRVEPGRGAGWRDLLRFLAAWWALDSALGVPAHAVFVVAGRPWRLRQHLLRLAAPLEPGRWLRRWAGRGSDALSAPTGAPLLAAGDTISFQLGSASLYCLGGGWRIPEVHGIWTAAREAVLHLDLAPGCGRVGLAIEVVPFVVPRRRPLRVEAVVDGVQSATWRFEETGFRTTVRRLDVPGVVGRLGRRIELRLVVHDPLAPVAAEFDTTVVPLGIALRQITLEHGGGDQPPP